MNFQNLGPIILLLGASYLLGSFNSGYYYGRLLKHQDIRTQGSSNPGALNTLRVFGPGAFGLVFLGDFAKGLVAVYLATWLQVGQIAMMMIILAVVLGHCYPVFMNFKGGKGVATFLGALASYDLFLIGLVIILFLVNFPLVRKFSISGLVALSLTVISAQFFKFDLVELLGLGLVMALILWRHRTNITQYLESRFTKPN